MPRLSMNAAGPGTGAPLRIAHLVVTDQFAGTERYCVDVSAELARRGHGVRVVGGSPALMPRLLTEAGVRWAPGAGVGQSLRSLVRGGRHDIVHTHMSKADFVALLASPATGGKRVATRHITARRGYSGHAQRLAGPVRARMAAELAVSRFVAEHVDSTVDRVLLNGVPDPVGATDAVREPEPVVLVAQRLVDEKDTATAVHAFARSGLADRGWRMDVAGEGPDRARLERTADELGLGPSVRFPGWVEDMTPLYRSAAVLLAPAPAEPCGLTVIEAMARAIPVVAAGSAGHLETLGQEPGAALFAPGDAATAAAHLRRLADDPGGRRAYGERLQRLQQDRLTLRTHVDELESIYRDVLAGRPVTDPGPIRDTAVIRGTAAIRGTGQARG